MRYFTVVQIEQQTVFFHTSPEILDEKIFE